jgi:hypothetical protein
VSRRSPASKAGLLNGLNDGASPARSAAEDGDLSFDRGDVAMHSNPSTDLILSSANLRSEPLVWVRRQWDDAQNRAAYRLEDVHNPFWDFVSGGVMAKTTQPWLYATVLCNEGVDGSLSHSCVHGRGPHRITVCIVQKGNEPRVFRKFATMAGPKPENREKRWWKR